MGRGWKRRDRCFIFGAKLGVHRLWNVWGGGRWRIINQKVFLVKFIIKWQCMCIKGIVFAVAVQKKAGMLKGWAEGMHLGVEGDETERSFLYTVAWWHFFTFGCHKNKKKRWTVYFICGAKKMVSLLYFYLFIFLCIFTSLLFGHPLCTFMRTLYTYKFSYKFLYIFLYMIFA